MNNLELIYLPNIVNILRNRAKRPPTFASKEVKLNALIVCFTISSDKK